MSVNTEKKQNIISSNKCNLLGVTFFPDAVTYTLLASELFASMKDKSSKRNQSLFLIHCTLFLRFPLLLR